MHNIFDPWMETTSKQVAYQGSGLSLISKLSVSTRENIHNNVNVVAGRQV